MTYRSNLAVFCTRLRRKKAICAVFSLNSCNTRRFFGIHNNMLRSCWLSCWNFLLKWMKKNFAPENLTTLFAQANGNCANSTKSKAGNFFSAKCDNLKHAHVRQKPYADNWMLESPQTMQFSYWNSKYFTALLLRARHSDHMICVNHKNEMRIPKLR